MISSQFNELLDKVSYGEGIKQNKVYITLNDFNNLSNFEKKTLRVIGNLRGVLMNSDNGVSYEELNRIIAVLSNNKSDFEKSYLLSLFFPEKVKNTQAILPFPIPTYTYIQKFPYTLTPNDNGAFLVQMICPGLFDGSATAGDGNIWVNVSAGLNGITLQTNTNVFTNIDLQRPPAGSFNTYVLQAAKIECKYVGRFDLISGYFGASQHISTVDSTKPDLATTQFQYVDDTLNATLADASEGLNVIYYPPDYSYLNFNKVNANLTTSGGMTTNMRLNLYGIALPAGVGLTPSIKLQFTLIYNILPSPGFTDLLPTTLGPMIEELDILGTSKFVPKSNLTTFTNDESNSIDKLLNLPKPIRERAVKEYTNLDSASKRQVKNILEIAKQIMGENINNKLVWDYDLVKAIVDEIEGRKPEPKPKLPDKKPNDQQEMDIVEDIEPAKEKKTIINADTTNQTPVSEEDKKAMEDMIENDKDKLKDLSKLDELTEEEKKKYINKLEETIARGAGKLYLQPAIDRQLTENQLGSNMTNRIKNLVSNMRNKKI